MSLLPAMAMCEWLVGEAVSWRFWKQEAVSQRPTFGVSEADDSTYHVRVYYSRGLTSPACIHAWVGAAAGHARSSVDR